jgi:AsmA protein
VLSGVEGNAKALKIGKLALDVDAKVGESALKARSIRRWRPTSRRRPWRWKSSPASIDLANPQMPMKQLKLPLAGSCAPTWRSKRGAGTGHPLRRIEDRAQGQGREVRAAGAGLRPRHRPAQRGQVPAAQGAKGEGSEGGQGGHKLDFSALKGHDIDGAIRIGALQVSKLKLAKLNAKLKLAGGRLDVAPLSVNLYEGTANGSLSLNANGNQLALKQNLSGVSINPLMKDLADKDLLEGRGNVALDVSSHGDSVTAMKKALGGTASLSLKDGAIKGINLAQSLRDIKGKLGQARLDAAGQGPATRRISPNSPPRSRSPTASPTTRTWP